MLCTSRAMPSPSASVSSDLKALYKSVITRHSLVRAKGEVLVLLFFFKFLFVRSTISRQSEGRFTPKFACGRTLVSDVSSPLLGVSGPGARKKGEMSNANGGFVSVLLTRLLFSLTRSSAVAKWPRDAPCDVVVKLVPYICQQREVE